MCLRLFPVTRTFSLAVDILNKLYQLPASIGYMSNMGARVARMFRNFNLESRVHREISKEKPRAAPRHEADLPASDGSSDGECSIRPPRPCVVSSGHTQLRRRVDWPGSDTTLPLRLLNEDPGEPSTLMCSLCVCFSFGDREIRQPEERPAADPPEVRVRGVERSGRRGQTGTLMASPTVDDLTMFKLSHFITSFLKTIRGCQSF